MQHHDIQPLQLRLVASVIALGGFLMGTNAIGHIMMNDLELKILIVGLCTAALSSAAATLTLRLATTTRAVIAAGLSFTVVAAIANSPLSFVMVSLFQHSPALGTGEIVGVAITSTFIGMFITIPLGLLFSALYVPTLVATFRAVRDRSRESLGLVLRALGVFVMVVGGCCAVSSLLLADDHDLKALSAPLVYIELSFAALGLATTLAAHLSLWSRRRWFERVLFDRVPGWNVVSLDELTVTSDLRPLFAGIDRIEGVLVRRVEGPAAGAYRTGDRLEPVALV